MRILKDLIRAVKMFRSCPIVDDDFPIYRDRLDRMIDKLKPITNKFPKVVTLCGSTRFKAEFEAAEKKLTLAGNIVLTVGCFLHADGVDGKGGGDKEKLIGPERARKLDKLHKEKISISDSIYVINVGGYIGSSTSSEIEYAKSLGLPIKYMFEGKKKKTGPSDKPSG
jgi:hypothetical protein